MNTDPADTQSDRTPWALRSIIALSWMVVTSHIPNHSLNVHFGYRLIH